MIFNKKKLIDLVFSELSTCGASFVDCGGNWNVDGAYTFYALDRYKPVSAFLVDTNFTELSLNTARRYNNLTLINDNFAKKSILSRIGKVDIVFFFDVLLHQVKPDWDEVLDMYSKIASRIVIHNPQYVASNKSIRLLDLGETEYFKNVPHTRKEPTYNALFDKMYEINTEHNRIWRDIHNVWQWGITDSDLYKHMDKLGFSLKYSKNYGQSGPLENFENHGFLFQKNGLK